MRRSDEGEAKVEIRSPPTAPTQTGFVARKALIFRRISLRFLLHGTAKLVCYEGPVAAVGAALGERGPQTHETRLYH